MVGLVHGLGKVSVQQVVILVHESFDAVQNLEEKKKKKQKGKLCLCLCLRIRIMKTLSPHPGSWFSDQYLAGVVLYPEAVVWQTVVGEEL